MEKNSYFSFTISLLNKLHISSHIIDNPDTYISSKIDKGLRAMLFGENNYSKLLINSPNEANENTIYRFFDEYKCNYIFFKIPSKEKNNFFYVGPYLPKLPSDEFIKNKANKLNLTEEQLNFLFTYYRNLPIIEDENIIISILDTLGLFIFKGVANYTIEYINYEIPDKRSPVYISSVFDTDDTNISKLTLEMIEKNYQSENILMNAISKGKLHKLDFIVSSILNKGTEKRLEDTLRNRKNYLIILNTILRKAAEQGDVHPFHIHKLSSSFAKKIEELYSIENSLELQKNMIRKYCLLVKEHSLKNYSTLIGKVITMISYDLTMDLSLNNLSNILNVNASYLSATFKKECNETLTNYVNRKRMETAAYYLTNTDKQIQIIAEECGIIDVNYFIKLFKKQYGVTPKQFKNNITK